MAYLDYVNAMLERFRTKHRDLLAAHAEVHLYAMVDPTALSQYERYKPSAWLAIVQRMSLYAGSGLDILEATGPVLLAMPDLRNTSKLTASSFSTRAPTSADVFVELLALATHSAAHVTWIWSPHEMGTLVAHLQTLLHARLGPDDEDAWFFFYQPSHLQVLHEQLPEVTRRHMFGPIHAWWMLSLHGQLVELEGEGAPVPPAWDAFPVPGDVVTALQRAAMPEQVHAWLEKTCLNLTTSPRHNGQVAEIAPLVKRALDYSLARKKDVVTFVIYGLHYKVDYDQHPHLQALLTGAADQGRPLAQAYRAVSLDVWDELAQTAQQRVNAQAARALHAALRKAGQISLRARIVNATGSAISGVFFDLPGNPHAGRQFVGSVDGRSFGEAVLDKEALVSPLPGDKLILHWIEFTDYAPGRCMRTPRRRELVVNGELPTEERSGLLEIRFGKYGEAIVMHKDEASFHKQ
ncbi:protein of unknown function [Cupriavidus sp. YR651]|uniref:DUF4123 domain-containing protein n=1 Tax=Cupriavidus sp. YR651 TaxID=1855315 RepID=UPI0008833DD7|nr:DUF4123 domain-containing protein [Cupriavidus sp. YR651]SDB98890.1 protein of unknown function [Cupriavidus sp. YR651]